MIPFNQLGCNEWVQQQFDQLSSELVLGRVTSLDRGYPLVNTQDESLRAELATTIKKSDDSVVAIGDWVALRIPQNHEKAIIEVVLERKNEIARIKRVGREKQVRRQVLAANVEKVLICQSLTGEGFDTRLALRQLAAVYGCDAHPMFAFTKCDLVDEALVHEAKATLNAIAPEVEVICLYDGDEQGVAQVREVCEASTTTLLLGESGVGKSTLVNALLGAEELATNEVRSSDDKGRHTTVARRMLLVPEGGLIIDAPGLRTLQILDLDASLEKMFPEIGDLSMSCRFSDCTHTHEPGCAVQGVVPQARLDAYLQLYRSKQFQ